MSNVELICQKSFSEADQEIVDKFIELQEALISKDLDKLDEIILEVSEFNNMLGKPISKSEFISEIADGTLDFSDSEILDPTILFDDENSASLIAKVRLTIGINDRELRLISDSVVGFKKIEKNWYISKWDN